MIFTATKREQSRAGRRLSINRNMLWALALAVLLAVGFLGAATALENTTLTVDLKGVTPSNADTWLSLSLSGRFDVSVGGQVIGRVTANPTAEQLAAGETDTLTVPDGGEVTLTPVAEDFADGFVCEGTIPLSLTQGQANCKTVFAYAKRGLFTLADVSAKDGAPLGAAEFVVMDAQGVMQWSFTTDENGTYTAASALPNGEYQLVQMRAPEGTMLLDQPTAFTVDTYFGTADSITALTVQNQPAPVENAVTGSLAVSAGNWTTADGASTATLQVDGLCAGENTAPLSNYTVTLNPAKLLGADGTELAADGALSVDTVTVTPAQGSCSVQPLDNHSQPTGEAIQCQTGDTVTLESAAGVVITYLNSDGGSLLPAGFTAGTVQAGMRYLPAVLSGAASAAATASVEVGVNYQYQYAGTDGISMVTADSAIEPQTLAFEFPDGRMELSATATAGTLADGTPVITLTADGQTWTGDALTLAAELPEGARALESAMPEGLRVLRTALTDWVVFDSTQWTSGAVQIPVAAGTVGALTVWALDPSTLPATADAPEGFALKAVAHEPKPLLDALLNVTNGQYARMDVTLPAPIATGKDPATLILLLSGSIGEQADQPSASVANLGVTLTGASGNTVYGALTDGNGSFAISGDAAETVGTLRAALPDNTMSLDTRETGVYTKENITLPQDGYAIAFVQKSGVSGRIETAEGKAVAGVSLSLTQNGQSLQTAQTDASGSFAFAALEAGDYSLRLTIPTDSGATLPAQDGVTAQADGSYVIDSLNLAYGENRALAITATLLCAARGIVTEGDSAVSGLTVTLSDAFGATQTAQTDASGAYAFEKLPAGTYQLALQLPANKAVVANGQAVQGVGNYTETLALGEGEARNEKLAIEATASITGQIEALGEGRDISAASVSAQLSAKTAQDGSFAFNGLIGGDYTVYAPLPEGKTLLETSEWKVSERGDMIWITVSVPAGENVALPAVEFVAMTGIEGVAYMDTNGDLGYADGEQLMSGVTVALQQKDGDSWADVTNQTTDAYGHYAFQNLKAGVYRVVSQGSDGVNVAAVGNQALPVGDGTLGVKASGDLTLANGDMLNGQSDIALSQPASVKVAAFFDSNEDGGRGVYERSVSGVQVEAVPAANAEGDASASAVTDQNGEATLTDLAPGSYVLRFTLPDGYLVTVNSGEWSTQSSCVGGGNGLVAVSDPLTLSAGETAEAGVGAIPVGSFSGTVWSDLNNNGVMDDGEPGVPNVKLTLTGAKTGASYELTTDDTGAYRFALLRNDTYNFTAEIPDTMLFARYTQTGGDSRSVFTAEGTSATRQFIVTDAQDVTNKNVGVVEKAALSGIAFLDSNYNGLYDEGEPPYAGVTLEVVKNSNDRSMGKVVTGEDGSYTFDSLRGGDYRLRAILPNDGSIFTVVPAEQDGGLANLFEAREGRRENTIPSVTVENGKTTQTCVGVAMGGTISGTVFLDAKYDGSRNDSDKKASGVKIQLVASDGTLAATATTNANGNYTLEGIMPGEYTVRVQRKENYAFTRYRPDEENGNHVKTLAKDGFGETEAITVAMGQQIEHINAGMLLSSTLTGVFFDDQNDNGLMDAGETGYTDVQVRLLSSDGELNLTESVGEDGTYFFDGVMPGEYTVTYILPDNATMAQVADGGNTVEAQGKENVVTGLKVESGKAYTAPLAGAVTLGSFEGYAYHDGNGNGVRDEGEEALSGVTVALAPAKAGRDPAKTTTDSEGNYSITGLRPDQYTLTLSLPQGYIFSANLTESSLTLDTAEEDSLACPWTALTNRAQNAIGAVKPATIRASVWLDENRDGQHSDDERLLSGLNYELYDQTTGSVVKSAASDEDGYVTFQNVRPATYTVRFAIPNQAQPADDANSTFEAQGAMMSHSDIVIAEGETFEDISGGLVSYTSIGGTVALDENGTRSPQAGVTVTLYQADSDQKLQTAQTDEKGEYRFDGLWPDSYRLEVGLPTGMIFVKPDDPNYQAGDSVVASTKDGLGVSDPFALEMAHHLLTQNVILIKPARVGDQVWLDTNKNGLRDADEPSVNGVTIQLMQNGEAVYTATSNEWGYYEMADVYPGTYTLQATAYPEFNITTAVTSLRIISSCLTQGDGNTATSDSFDVQSGSQNFDMDLGYVLRDGQAMPEAVTPGSVQNWTAASPTPTP
ncbi:MAG TPA: SdrD B-like domain-containing protein [Candidatus Limiplasma sp.]|nr:SdrD B-like domain-containing protein [Candidatus Limiplasma sp.]HPS80664.1 SdrD B-like domain-containing protein [Candidatus Limiplasma sp.]